MKTIKKLLVLVIAIVAMAGISSCSKRGNLDGEGLKTMLQKSSKELTTADVDFFLDQAEILINTTKDMDKKEMEEYMETLTQDQKDGAQAIVMVLAFGDLAKKNKEIWSDSQLERFKKLQQQISGKIK